MGQLAARHRRASERLLKRRRPTPNLRPTAGRPYCRPGADDQRAARRALEAAMLRDAYTHAFGEPPTPRCLAVAWARSPFEHAHGRDIYCTTSATRRRSAAGLATTTSSRARAGQ